MNTDLVYFEADMDLKDAFMKMQQHKHGLIPVKRRGDFVGVVDLENMQEFIMLRSAHPEGTEPMVLGSKNNQAEHEADSY